VPPGRVRAQPSLTLQPSDLKHGLLHHRSFLLFWLARTSTTIAIQMQAVAVGWQMYDLTSNPLDLGLIGLAQFVPSFLLALASGQFADRHNRRHIIQLGQLVETLAVAMLTFATATNAISQQLIFASVFLVGVGRAFEQPTQQALVPAIIPADLFPRAVAATASATKIATIAGPAAGGVLYLVNPTSVYVVCCGLLILALLLMGWVRTERAVATRQPVTLAMVFAGFAFIRGNPIILGAISLDLFAVLFGGATALLPVFARDVFAVGPWGLGLMRAAPAIGAVAMSFVLARWPLRQHVGRLMYRAVAVFGIVTIVFGLSTSFPLSIIALTILGASDMVSIVIRQTLVQIETPDGMRGRVSAVNSMFVGTSNQLGDFESGLTAAWFGTVPSVVIGGIATILVVLLWARLFPAVFQVETLARRPPHRSDHPTQKVSP
jgi:MFS family permease